MPSTDPQYVSGKLTALLGLIALPAEVSRAIGAFTAAAQLRVPAPPPPTALIRRATIREADRLAREAAVADQPAFVLDVSAITDARAQEQQATDRQALAQQVRDAAAVVLAEAVARSRGELIAAIQAKHEAIVTDLRKRARRLPPGADEQFALERGGQYRADYLAARDAVAELDRLRDALRLVDSHPPPEPVDGIAICSVWERTGLLAETWLAHDAISTYGPIDGGLSWWLSIARVDSYDLWLPTAAQQEARIAEIRADRHTQRVQAAL
jgi:hypothetical protein